MGRFRRRVHETFGWLKEKLERDPDYIPNEYGGDLRRTAKCSQQHYSDEEADHKLLTEERDHVKNWTKKGDKKSSDKNLTGIALSGGGIRSATFSLGVLQALARHDVLQFIDYISTVSGGGYIGSGLT